MKERVQTYVPQSSVVGMLLNHEEMIHVVKRYTDIFVAA